MTTRNTFIKSLLGLFMLPLAAKAKSAQDLNVNPCMDIKPCRGTNPYKLTYVGRTHDSYCFKMEGVVDLQDPEVLKLISAEAQRQGMLTGSTIDWRYAHLPDLGGRTSTYVMENNRRG